MDDKKRKREDDTYNIKDLIPDIKKLQQETINTHDNQDLQHLIQHISKKIVEERSKFFREISKNPYRENLYLKVNTKEVIYTDNNFPYKLNIIHADIIEKNLSQEMNTQIDVEFYKDYIYDPCRSRTEIFAHVKIYL